MKTRLNKILHFPITRIIIGLLVVVPITIVFKNYITKPLLGFIFSEDTVIKEVIQHLVSIITMVLLYYYTYKIIEKRSITELNFRKNYALLGLFLGIFSISIMIAVFYILGYYRITGINNNFSMPRYIAHIFVAAMWEEIMFRVIAYRILEEWLGTIWGLILSVIVFGGMHYLNDDPNLLSVLSATSGGLLMGILYTYRKNIWLIVFYHFGWNMTQLLWGCNLSGNNDIEQFLTIQLNGPTILTGGILGIENSIFVFIICTILFSYFLKKSFKNGGFVRIKHQKII